MPLPWMPKVVRHLLMSQASFAALIAANRVVFKAPADVTALFAVIQAPGNNSLSGDGVAWSPLVQFDAYCPASQVDAEEVVWNVAAAAGMVLGRARNVTYDNVTYSGRLLDGPIPDRDTSRGQASVLARAVVRAELRLHNR